MNNTALSQAWDSPFRAARAFDNLLEIASQASKAMLVGALTAPVPFYWNPPFWTIVLSWPRMSRKPQEPTASLLPPADEPASNGRHANDNAETGIPMAA